MRTELLVKLASAATAAAAATDPALGALHYADPTAKHSSTAAKQSSRAAQQSEQTKAANENCWTAWLWLGNHARACPKTCLHKAGLGSGACERFRKATPICSISEVTVLKH